MNTIPKDEYELIATLALGLRAAEQAGDTDRARWIAATLSQQVHIVAVLAHRLDYDDAPAAAIMHNNGSIDTEYVRRLLAVTE